MSVNVKNNIGAVACVALKGLMSYLTRIFDNIGI